MAKILRAAGHEVFTPTLTGMGEREHLLSPAVDLNLHIQDIVNVLEFEDLRDVILAGHSYTGMVITGVADRALDRVGHLVYLDATQPRNGESQEDVIPDSMAAAKRDARMVGGMLMALMPDSEIVGWIRGNLTGEHAWMMGLIRPLPYACYEQKLVMENEEAVLKIPKTCVNCTATLKAWSPQQYERTTHADNVWEIDTGHDLMVSEPEKDGRISTAPGLNLFWAGGQSLQSALEPVERLAVQRHRIGKYAEDDPWTAIEAVKAMTVPFLPGIRNSSSRPRH